MNEISEALKSAFYFAVGLAGIVAIGVVIFITFSAPGPLSIGAPRIVDCTCEARLKDGQDFALDYQMFRCASSIEELNSLSATSCSVARMAARRAVSQQLAKVVVQATPAEVKKDGE